MKNDWINRINSRTIKRGYGFTWWFYNAILLKQLHFMHEGYDEDITSSDTYTLKSESSSTWTSFPSRIPETVCTKNDATTTYEVHFMRSLYGWKYNFITFPMPPDSGPYLFGVDRNSRNKSMSRIWKGAAPPLLGQWPVYRVGPSAHVVGPPGRPQP